jgi:hypothetical protein
MWEVWSSFARTVKYGVLLGLAGGIAEVIWIALYGSMAAIDPSEVSLAINAAVQRALPGLPLVTTALMQGILIHMVAAVALGVALAFIWRSLLADRQAPVNEYTFMIGALTIIWALNFFVVLPLISPAYLDLHRAFVELVPYPVSLASKILFGLAGAVVMRWNAAPRSQMVLIRVLAR